MTKPFPIAVAFSDLHLSLTAPACRADKDWLGVQQHYLEQLKDIAKGLPILFAGDLFDRWNPPPELINFALKHLPDNMLCIPGQHDLPNHQIEDMHRCGYGVLVQAGKIKDMSTCPSVLLMQDVRGLTPTAEREVYSRTHRVSVRGFGWGQEVKAPPSDARVIYVALIHKFVWASHYGYPGAPEEMKLGHRQLDKTLAGYDVSFWGDNHQGFLAASNGHIICNCGGFIRRKSDEMEREPFVGVLYSNGQVQRHKLDTSIDRFHAVKAEAKPETPLDVAAFINELNKLGEHGLDFREAVRNHLRKDDIDSATKQIILEAMEQA